MTPLTLGNVQRLLEESRGPGLLVSCKHVLPHEIRDLWSLSTAGAW